MRQNPKISSTKPKDSDAIINTNNKKPLVTVKEVDEYILSTVFNVDPLNFGNYE